MTNTTKDTKMEKRQAREYTIDMSDDGGVHETGDTIIPEGTESEQDAAAEKWARETAIEWANEGDWGDDITIVTVYYVLSDLDSDWERRHVDVTIEDSQRWK
jgi:hypothetical protein